MESNAQISGLSPLYGKIPYFRVFLHQNELFSANSVQIELTYGSNTYHIAYNDFTEAWKVIWVGYGSVFVKIWDFGQQPAYGKIHIFDETLP